MRCPALILLAMGKTYPDQIDLDAVSRQTRLDGPQVRAALWELVDRGLVDVPGSPSWAGLPWSVPRLSEAGMAVAFGLAAADDDAGEVIDRLEAATLRQLNRLGQKTSTRPFRAAPSRGGDPAANCGHCTD